MDTLSWLVMNYTLPKEPSRARVSVWRKLKKAGAVNIQQSMWILPDTVANNEALNTIKAEVISCGGEAFVMRSTADDKSNAVFIERLNAARSDEYSELLEQCSDFLNEIKKETERKNFSFAEIEENEEDLEKLNKWFDLICARDAFCARMREESAAKIGECVSALEAFSERVYEAVNKESD